MSHAEAVVVFGASGFIGRNIIDALQGSVDMLVGVNQSGTSVPGCTLTVASSHLHDIPALPEKTVLINVASFRYYATRFAADQADILACNSEIYNQVYRFALERKITEVRAASSSAVYPAEWDILDDARPIDLNAWPHLGEAPYAWSKRWGEILADLWYKKEGIHTLSFRLTNPYGPYDTLSEDDAHVATAFVLRALSDVTEFEIRGNPHSERDFVFAGDVGITFAQSLGLSGVHDAVNLARGETTRIVDLATTVMDAAAHVRPLKMNPPPSANGVLFRRATDGRLRQIMPDLPAFADLATGMKKTIEWYRDALQR